MAPYLSRCYLYHPLLEERLTGSVSIALGVQSKVEKHQGELPPGLHDRLQPPYDRIKSTSVFLSAFSKTSGSRGVI